jgi:hypothetical protein
MIRPRTVGHDDRVCAALAEQADGSQLPLWVGAAVGQDQAIAVVERDAVDGAD